MTASLGLVTRVQVGAIARRPMTWILVLVLGAYLLLVLGSFVILLAAPATAQFDPEAFVAPMRAAGLLFIAGLYASIASILIVILASSLIGHEFSRGTLRTLLLAGVRRGRLTVAQVLALALTVAVATVAGLVVTLAAAAAFSAVAGEDFIGLADEDAAGVAVVLGRVALNIFIVLGVWGVIAYSITLLTRSLMAGIGATLATQILGDVAASLLWGLGDVGVWIGRLLPNTAITALTGIGTPDFDAVDAAWITANLLIYVVGGLWLATARFRRIDALAATKAG